MAFAELYGNVLMPDSNRRWTYFRDLAAVGLGPDQIEKLLHRSQVNPCVLQFPSFRRLGSSSLGLPPRRQWNLHGLKWNIMQLVSLRLIQIKHYLKCHEPVGPIRLVGGAEELGFGEWSSPARKA